MRRPRTEYAAEYRYGHLHNKEMLRYLKEHALQVHVLAEGSYKNGTDFVRLEIVVPKGPRLRQKNTEGF